MAGQGSTPEEILREQQRYYDERAHEYDEWWLRQGRYDRGPEENTVWFREQDEVRIAFEAIHWSGHVLELAGGTGIWTEWLARRADQVTVLDGSQEMIHLNSTRLEASGYRNKIEYRQVDLFEWRPDQQYDGVFIGYFLSHVPSDRLDRFLARVADAIRRGGVLGIIDGQRDNRSSSPDQPAPPPATELMTRRLNDGRTFQIVKRFDDPDELAAALARHGVAAEIRTTMVHFLYGVGRKV